MRDKGSSYVSNFSGRHVLEFRDRRWPLWGGTDARYANASPDWISKRKATGNFKRGSIGFW